MTKKDFFNMATDIQDFLKTKGFRYCRRFSEPRTNSYRCKWWIATQINADIKAQVETRWPVTIENVTSTNHYFKRGDSVAINSLIPVT